MGDYASTRTGTIGGTLTVILANITSYELVKTALLAAVGTAVSFVMSIILQKFRKSSAKEPPAKQG